MENENNNLALIQSDDDNSFIARLTNQKITAWVAPRTGGVD